MSKVIDKIDKILNEKLASEVNVVLLKRLQKGKKIEIGKHLEVTPAKRGGFEIRLRKDSPASGYGVKFEGSPQKAIDIARNDDKFIESSVKIDMRKRK